MRRHALAGVAGMAWCASIALVRSPADLAMPAVVAAFAVMGYILAGRRPDNRIGWLLLTAAALLAGSGVADGYVRHVAVPGSGSAALGRALFALLFFPGFVLILSPLLLLFPTGHPPTERWRWVLWTAAGFAILAGVGNGFEGGEPIADVSIVLGLPAILGAVASLVARYRRGGAVERAQLKWFVTAALVLPVAIGVGDTVREHEHLQGLIVSAGLIPLPIAVGVGVLRYRLYEIDRLVSRTLAYAVLSALLVAVYLGSVTVLTAVTSPVTDDSPIAVAAATLLAAAAFQPLRRRIQGAVDRRFNRARYDAALAVAAYRARLRDELELEAITADLVATVRDAVEPVGTAVWLRPAEGTS